MDQVPSFPTHQTPASSLSPSQHAAASHTQARLPVWLETIVQPPKNAQSQVNAQAPLFTPLDEIFDSSIEDSLHFNPYSQVPTWLADEHFDLNALNSSVMASTLGFFSPDYTANEDSTDITIQLLENLIQSARKIKSGNYGSHMLGHISLATSHPRLLKSKSNWTSNTDKRCRRGFNNVCQPSHYHLRTSW